MISSNLNLLVILLQVHPDLMSTVLQQSPVIILFAVLVYGLWTYIKEKNAVIKSKDTLLIEQHKTLMDLYGQAVESQTKLTTVIEELRKDLDRERKLRPINT